MSEQVGVYHDTLRVYAAECDVTGRWKPAALFHHLTEAAHQHANRLGVGYAFMLPHGLYWVHARMRVRFRRLPGMAEMLTIRTWPRGTRQRLYYIRDFEVQDAAGSLLAAATSAWLVIDAATRRVVPASSAPFELPAGLERSALDEPLERLNLAAGGEERLRVRAAYSAVDLLGHVNNSRYIEWLCDAFPLEVFRERRIEWLQVNYEREVRPGEQAAVLVNPVPADPNLYAVEGRNLVTGERAFEAALRWTG